MPCNQKSMTKNTVLSLTVLFLGLTTASFAVPVQTPEINPSSLGSALALLGGGILAIRGRKRS
jgi:hypothetical protein